jgi:hypothetical protein
MATSLRETLTKDTLSSGPSMRARCDAYGATSLRQLAAGVVSRDYHRRVYGDFGVLGAATGSITPVDGGYTQDFLNGQIQVLGTELRPSAEVQWDCLVEYVGIRCDEPNEQGFGSDGDEPYVIFTVVSLNPSYTGEDELVAVHKIGPLSGVREGDVIGDTQSMSEGIVAGTGLKIKIGVYESDEGDSDDVREEIEAKIKEYAGKAVSALTAAYGAGDAEATNLAGSELVTWGARILSLGIVELLGLGDDPIGENAADIPLSKIREYDNDAGFQASLTRTTEGLLYNYKLPVSSDEGEYSVYFRVRSRKIGPIEKLPDLP